jgi:3-phenylpropionate/trans-cinnamate dioxygenase ferredoxin subunit
VSAELARIPLAAVETGRAVRVEGGEAGICVVRIGDRVFAIGDRCSHAAVSLAEGEVDARERVVECWLHGSAFSLETGEALSLPAVRPVPVYQARIEGDDIVVHEAGE